MARKNILPANSQKLVSACLKHASNLLAAAKLVVKEKLPNVAYHLAVLALEEVGKASMLTADAAVSIATNKSDLFLSQKLEDHYFKIFWAIWQISPKAGRLTPEGFREAQNLALNIHKRRLDALYVSEQGLLKLAAKDVGTIIRLVEARLNMESLIDLSGLTTEGIQALKLMIESIENPDIRPKILSKQSLQKLEELESPRAWFSWFQEELVNEEKQMRELLDRELNRQFPKGKEKLQPKWKIRLRLVAAGFELKPKAFELWNKQISNCKLQITKERERRFLADLYLPKVIHVQELMHLGQQEAFRLILAFNIGSMGFVWWYNLHEYSRFFERIEDVDTNDASLGTKERPFIDVVWREKGEKVRKLSERDIQNIILSYAMLPHSLEQTEEKMVFSHYLRAITLFAKHDSFMPFTINVGLDFLQALFAGMSYYGQLPSKNDFLKMFMDFYRPILKEEEDQQLFEKIITAFVNGNEKEISKLMNMQTVLKTKVLCDAYFLKQFQIRMPLKAEAFKSKSKGNKKDIKISTSNKPPLNQP